MGKSKSASKDRTSSLPKAPWLYINDPNSENVLGDGIVGSLKSLIPKAEISPFFTAGWVPNSNSMDETVYIFVDRELDLTLAAQAANTFREKTIELGKNFASVNMTSSSSVVGDGDKIAWGTIHMDVNVTSLTARQTADKIFKWLCKLPLPVERALRIAWPALNCSLVLCLAYAN